MLTSQKHLFTRRPFEDGLHDGAISSGYKASKDTEEFRVLNKQVYSEHKIGLVFSEPDVFLAGTNITNPEYITWLFHKGDKDSDGQSNYFIKPNLSKGGPKGAKYELNEFAEHIIKPVTTDINDISFLVGDIGMGKSTLISNIFANFGTMWFQEENIIPIHIDTDSANKHKVPSKKQALSGIYDQILNEIKSLRKRVDLISQEELVKIESITFPMKKIQKKEGYRCWVRAIQRLIEMLSEATNKRLILFIDNLDYLYHIHDREHFSKEKNGQAVKARKFIEEFVSLFTDWGNGALKYLGIKIIFTLRPDSLDQLQRNVKLLGGHKFVDDDQIFFYKSPETYEVLMGRYEMLSDLIKIYPDKGRVDKYIKHLKSYEEILNHWSPENNKNKKRGPCNKNLIERLSLLSKQGLRQVISHMSSYSWIGENGIDSLGADIDKRFATQSSPSILAFTLNGYRMFSQTYSVFPNFYLVDSRVTLETYEKQGFKEDLLKEHRHTYWLKRLIAEYVLKKHKDSVSFNDVIDIFSCTSEDDSKPNGYEQSIVRLCTASLCQTDLSAVLTPTLNVSAPGNNVSVGELHPTTRGKHILECYVDSFEYLQLILDDNLLSFPKCIDHKMNYYANLDYGYLVQGINQYSASSRRMISHKASQVFLLLEVLEKSLDIEKRLYPLVFDRLDKAEVKIPNVNKMRENLIHSLGNLRLSQGLELPESYMSNAKNAMKDLDIQLEEIYSYVH